MKADKPSIEKFNEEEDDVPVVKSKGLSYWDAFTNFVRTLLGVGCLALPVAVKDAGWLVAVILIFTFGFLNAHCMVMLIHSAQYLSRKKGEGRLELGQVVFDACSNSFDFMKKYSMVFKVFVNICLFCLQMGITSVYYVFVAVHTKELTEQYTDIRLSETMYMLMMFLPFILVNCLRTLKVIAILSGMGNVVMCGCLIVIFQYLIRQPHLSLSSLPAVTSFDGIMTACGAILYAYEGQAIVLPLENKIKKSDQMLGFTGVISTGMSTVTVIYAVCGFLGFITYGENVKGSIALNLPEDPLYSILRGFLVLVVFTGFAIQQYVVIELTFPTFRAFISKFFNFSENQKNSKFCESSENQKKSKFFNFSENQKNSKFFLLFVELVYRIFLVFVCMVIAITVPNLEEIIPLVGITCGMMIAFVFPPFIDTLVFLPRLVGKFKKSPEENKWSLGGKITITVIKNLFLIFMGIFGLLAGLRASVGDLMK